ncbi:hypothetical protein ANANG_G00000690, partial [Anguilla anguilla]
YGLFIYLLLPLLNQKQACSKLANHPIYNQAVSVCQLEPDNISQHSTTPTKQKSRAICTIVSFLHNNALYIRPYSDAIHIVTVLKGERQCSTLELNLYLWHRSPAPMREKTH